MKRRMLGSQLRLIAGAVAITVLQSAASEARPLVVPFDFSRSAIVLEVKVRGTLLHMFLDTDASPSAIDTARAQSLGLKIDFAGGGESSGEGSDAHAMVYPTSLEDLTIGGRRFGAVEALAADMKAVRTAYGRPIDGTLGHSFLAGKLLLIDYPAGTITIFDRKAEPARQLLKCRKACRVPLRSFQGDTVPIVEMRIGRARLPVGIDTGANDNVELYKRALDEPTLKSALVEAGTTKATGDRGVFTMKINQLNAPVRLGPFALPAGQTVTLSSNEGSPETRLANVGNKLFASMRLKLLLDYRENQIAFFGDCAE